MIDTSHPVLGGMAVRSHYHKQEEQRMQLATLIAKASFDLGGVLSTRICNCTHYTTNFKEVHGGLY